MSQRPTAKSLFRLRNDLQRRKAGDVECPLGVYPSATGVSLRQGYQSAFLMGQEGMDDHCEYRILLGNDRLFDVLTRIFVEFLPDKVFGLFEEFSYDAWRETDAWASAEPVSKQRFLQAWELFGRFFVEDGRCGFGARGDEPRVEVFLEEHGAVYIACGFESRERVEEMLAEFGLPELDEVLGIENHDHRHEDVLDLSDGAVMDDLDIKFSVIESLGMTLTNGDDMGPVGEPQPFWIYLELDLTFDAEAEAQRAYISLAVTAHDHEEARSLAEARLLERFPSALVARYLQIYRIGDSDISAEIAPLRRDAISSIGVWFESSPEYWA